LFGKLSSSLSSKEMEVNEGENGNKNKVNQGSRISLSLSARVLDFRHESDVNLVAEFERANGVVFAGFLEWS